MFSWNLFKRKRSLLAIQALDEEIRYVLSQGNRVIKSGMISLPTGVVVGGRLMMPEGIRAALMPELQNFSGLVSVLLTSDLVHAHMLTLPTGLDNEELDYQATRHITQTIGLSLSDVYYDWLSLPPKNGASEQPFLVVIARQADVAPYGQVFDEDWQIRWVLPECFVWANAYPDVVGHVLVVRVEQSQLSLWHVDGSGMSHYFSRKFDEQAMSQAGFVYQSDSAHGKSAVRLPMRFVVDEITDVVARWLSADAVRQVGVLYGLGKGVDWDAAQSPLQQKLGFPVRGVLNDEDIVISGMAGQEDSGCLGGLWFMSKMVSS